MWVRQPVREREPRNAQPGRPLGELPPPATTVVHALSRPRPDFVEKKACAFARKALSRGTQLVPARAVPHLFLGRERVPRIAMRGSPSDFTKAFSDFQKKAWGDGAGMAVPPNLGGERVVRKTSKPPSAPATLSTGDGAFTTRKALVLGLLAQPVFYLGAQSLNNRPALSNGGAGAGAPMLAPGGGRRGRRVALEDIDEGSYYDGDAVTSPALEIELLELLEDTKGPRGAAGMKPDPKIDPIANKLITTLEGRGGTQIGASAGEGRWVLPWVGGWERVFTNSNDATFTGGPRVSSFNKGGTNVEQVSGRWFVYGPGEGGICVEYLHAYQGDDKAPVKFLLTRSGKVTNLGGNVFQLDFEKALDEYEAIYDRVKDVDRLANCVPTLNADGSPTGLLECKPTGSGSETSAPTNTLLVRTTCARAQHPLKPRRAGQPCSASCSLPLRRLITDPVSSCVPLCRPE